MTCSPTPCTASQGWQRIFDFGEASTTSSGSYLFLTPRSNASGPSRGALTSAGASAEDSTGFSVDGPTLNAGSYHFALVVDATAGEAALYVDGEPAGSAAIAGALSSVVDENCWLGRSQYASDPYLNGTYDEFRVYDAALSASALAQSFAAGPDAAFF
jgi:hypothetical protein